MNKSATAAPTDPRRKLVKVVKKKKKKHKSKRGERSSSPPRQETITTTTSARRDNDERKTKKRKKKRKRSSRSRDASRSNGRSSRRSRSHSPRDRKRRRRRSRSRSPRRGYDDRRSRQRSSRYEKHSARKERTAARDDQTVLVAQLHPNVEELDIFELFSDCGTVVDVRILRDARTNRSKGICYVEFEDKAAVGKALLLDGSHMQGMPIAMSSAIAKEKPEAETQARVAKTYFPTLDAVCLLDLKYVHASVTDEEMMELCRCFGPVRSLLFKARDPEVSWRSCMVRFERDADCERAMQGLAGLVVAGESLFAKMTNATTGTTCTPASGATYPEADNALASEVAPTASAAVNLTEANMDVSLDGGVAMSATDRTQLMLKLSRGAAMPGLIKGAAQPPVPSSCLLLSNVFNPAEETEASWSDEIRADVEEECVAKGGAVVEHIFVDRQNPSGFIYLRMATPSAAQKVADAFQGRFFGKRQLQVTMIPDASYADKFKR